MVDFYITTNKGIMMVGGYKLSNNLYCYKYAKNKWSITDYDSGLLLTYKEKLSDCYSYSKDCIIDDKIKNSKRYKSFCKKLDEWKEKYL